MHPMLNIGIRAAHAAGDLIVRYIDRIEGMTVDSKGRNDFVSEVDKQAEAIIINHIRAVALSLVRIWNVDEARASIVSNAVLLK